MIELYQGRMSYRELWVLVNRLPQESWTQTILRDQPKSDLRTPTRGEQKFGPWAHDNFQMADLIDAVGLVYYAVLATNSKNGANPPKPTPRPGMKPDKRPVDETAMARLLGVAQPPADGEETS